MSRRKKTEIFRFFPLTNRKTYSIIFRKTKRSRALTPVQECLTQVNIRKTPEGGFFELICGQKISARLFVAWRRGTTVIARVMEVLNH